MAAQGPDMRRRLAEPIPGMAGVDEDVEDFGYRAPSGGKPGAPLSLDEVRGIVQREIEDANGGYGTTIGEQRRGNLRAYYGKPIGNEKADRSSIVMRDVLEVVEWTMPSLVQMFTGGQYIWKFKPIGEEDQRNAELATAYINKEFMDNCDGFQTLYDWMKTALIEKNGIVKPYWKEVRSPQRKRYSGMTLEEVTEILSNPDTEPLAVDEYVEDISIQGEIVQVPLYDLEVKTWEIRKGLAVDGVPPEEFISARRMIKLDDPGMVGQRKKMTVSQLVEMGFPYEQVSMIPSDDGPEYSLGRTERLSKDETFPVTTAERLDAASRELWLTECHITIDEDGDGYAERRKIFVAGDGPVHILEDEEENFQPFCSLTPVPTPHKFYGESLADLVYDLQVIRSTIVRQILDNLYLSNNPRLAVVEGMVEINDLLTSRPGGLIRQRAAGQIEPVQLPPLPREAFALLEYMEDVRANRTGVLAHGRDLDASAINSTATGLASMMAEKQQKVALIGRIFAATGMKHLGEKLLRLTIENDSKSRQVEINGEWMTIDPSQWRSGFGVQVELGFGAGAAIERRQAIKEIMEVQDRMAAAGGAGYLVTPENLFNSGKELTQTAGFNNPNLFFSDPSGRPPPQPPPDPDMEKVRFAAMKEEQEIRIAGDRLAFDAQKEADLVRHRREDLEMKERVEMARIKMEREVRMGQQEATVEAAEISASAQRAKANGASKPNGESR